MPNAKNEAMLAEITEMFQKTEGMWLVNYRGLTVKQAQTLRRSIREVGGQMKVYKNSLVELAMKNLELPEMSELLSGPTAFVFFNEDFIGAAKAIKTFAKDVPALELKGGLLNGEAQDAEAAMAIADLPSRDQLIAKLLGTMQNPVTKFARCLSLIAEQKDAA